MNASTETDHKRQKLIILESKVNFNPTGWLGGDYMCYTQNRMQNCCSGDLSDGSMAFLFKVRRNKAWLSLFDNNFKELHTFLEILNRSTCIRLVKMSLFFTIDKLSLGSNFDISKYLKCREMIYRVHYTYIKNDYSVYQLDY